MGLAWGTALRAALRASLSLALLGGAGLAVADDCAPVGVTAITVSRAADNASAHGSAQALASYRFAAPIACLALGQREHGKVRALTWQLQTPGAVLSADGNSVHFAAPRRDFTVRLHPFEHDGAIDRVYSPVIAFGDHAAVAVYSSYLYPASTTQGVQLAFDGFLPTAPQRPVGPQQLGIEQTYLILGRPTVMRRGKIAAVVDQALPAWLASRVHATIAQGESTLRDVVAAPRALTYLISFTEPGMPGANWRGDTLDTLVRLNFMGAPWQTSAVDQHDAIDNFILHEMFHTASSPALNPALAGAMTLSEGGAEAGARAMRRRLDPAPGTTLPADIDNALARCTELGGATLADKETQSQRQAPYACGMALQFMVAAAVQRDPLAIWQTLLRSAKPLEAGWPALLAAAAAIGKPDRGGLDRLDSPAVLAVLDAMTASRLTWASGVAQLTTLGLLRRLGDAELAGPAYNERYRSAAIFHLLQQSCRSSYGFSVEPGVAVLDAPPGTCGAAPDRFRLVTMQGIDLQREAYRAYAELARRCAAQGPVTLGDDQGRTVALACATAAPPIALLTLTSRN